MKKAKKNGKNNKGRYFSKIIQTNGLMFLLLSERCNVSALHQKKKKNHTKTMQTFGEERHEIIRLLLVYIICRLRTWQLTKQ